MPILSQRAYARQRKVNLSAVLKAIRSGRIETLPDGRIDSEKADRQWERNTQTRAPSMNAPREQTEPDDESAGFGVSQYSKARAVREHYLARLAKIDFEERSWLILSSTAASRRRR